MKTTDHKWKDHRCINCGVVRAEMKQIYTGDEKFKDHQRKFQYSRDGRHWTISRPNCIGNPYGISGVKECDNKESFSIKEIIKREAPEKIDKFNYSDLLKHPKWQKKRLEIFQRDEFTCKVCGDTEATLHVHHKEYTNGHKPWEYDNSNLITVCEDCHVLIEKYKKDTGRFPDDITILKISNPSKFPEKFYFLKYPGIFNFSVFDNKKLLYAVNFGDPSFDKIKNFILSRNGKEVY